MNFMIKTFLCKVIKSSLKNHIMAVWDLAVPILGCFVFLGGCELPGLVYYGKRSDLLCTYSKVSPAGIQQCVRACFLNGACKSVNFDRSQLICHLNDHEVPLDSLSSDSDFVFITNITGSQVRVFFFWWGGSLKISENLDRSVLKMVAKQD